MDDKSNVHQPTAQEQSGERVRQNPNRREQREGGQVTDARAVSGGRGVEILGGGPRGGLRVENEEPSLETTVELGGPGTDERDEDGRRVFRK